MAKSKPGPTQKMGMKSPSTLKQAGITAPHPGPVKTSTKSPGNPGGSGMKGKGGYMGGKKGKC